MIIVIFHRRSAVSLNEYYHGTIPVVKIAENVAAERNKGLGNFDQTSSVGPEGGGGP